MLQCVLRKQGDVLKGGKKEWADGLGRAKWTKGKSHAWREW
jgi:hypothetical protein